MSTLKSYSDDQLLELVKVGDSRAFSEVFNRYWESTYIHILKMTGDDMEAKDIVQDTFTALWNHPDKIKNNGNLAGFLYVSAKNRVLNRFESLKNQARLLESFKMFQNDSNINVIDKIQEQELRQLIDKIISDLPDKMRQIFEYSRNQELSHREIAEILGISEGTVKKQVQNALKIIRTKVDPKLLIFFLFVI